MSEAAAFLTAIRANPADDTPRLVFADWLDDHGRPDEAAVIRLGCRLEPDFDRFDDEVNRVRGTLNNHTSELKTREEAWFRERLGIPRVELVLEWRRGFVETLGVPARWFVEHGPALRERYPFLRRLVVFRLNGWGKRLAACPALLGVPELELACWYGDGDAAALARSPHLGGLDRLVVWGSYSARQARAWGRGLQKVRVIEQVKFFGGLENWTEEVNRAAGREIATVYDFNAELFPFAPGSVSDFMFGKVGDGRQLVARQARDGVLVGWTFLADGTRSDPFRLQLPAEIAFWPKFNQGDDVQAYHEKIEGLATRRADFLLGQVGFVPGFVRVAEFNLGEGFEFEEDEADETDGPRRWNRQVEDDWGRTDPPDELPEKADFQNGHGHAPYHYVRGGCYGFRWGDIRGHDRSGHCIWS